MNAWWNSRVLVMGALCAAVVLVVAVQPRSDDTRPVSYKSMEALLDRPHEVPAAWNRGAMAAAITVSSTDSALAGPEWPEGSRHAGWVSVFNGGGSVRGNAVTITMRPAIAATPERTHAALVVSEDRVEDFTVAVRTTEQLRPGTPNPWEVGWVLWAYQDPTHFYYVILKPNGWEIGKADPAYPGNQRFLATGRGHFPIGSTYAVRVLQQGARSTVWVGSDKLATVEDADRPYPGSAVGLYTEDAAVQFTPLVTHRQ